MNQLEITFRAKITVVSDSRYRCLITLIRSDRPRYWNFKCFNDGCDYKVAELQNYEVLAADDFYDPQNVNNAAVGRHCKGTLPNGTACPYSYFFKLG